MMTLIKTSFDLDDVRHLFRWIGDTYTGWIVDEKRLVAENIRYQTLDSTILSFSFFLALSLRTSMTPDTGFSFYL